VESGDLFDDESFRTPPSPDDRLWRHPSEIGWMAQPPRRQRPTAALAVASGVCGAVLAIGALAMTGSLGTRVLWREVIEREAAEPVLTLTSVSDDSASRLAGSVAPSIVLLRIDGASTPSGAGVVFRDDGHALTNAHVVGAASTVVAEMSDGRTVEAEVVGADHETDLAVIKLSGEGPFVPAVLGTSDGVAVGDSAVAVGARIATGVISALGREIKADGGRILDDLVQTDAEIDVASSGGALLRDDGAVIGITTAYAGMNGIGFATPVDVARVIADDLVTHGRVRPVWFGIRGISAPDGGGVVLAEVFADGPAALAGLLGGDVIRRIDGHPVSSMAHLRVLLRRTHPDDAVVAVFDRDGRRRETTVRLAERSTTG
jgi:S1-C subfamily serine protease